MLVVNILQVTAMQHALHVSLTTAMRTRTSVLGFVYAKVGVVHNVYSAKIIEPVTLTWQEGSLEFQEENLNNS